MFEDRGSDLASAHALERLARLGIELVSNLPHPVLAVLDVLQIA